MVATQSDANRFFVDEVLEQARHERVTLSTAEQRMLSWSESDPAFVPDGALVEQLAGEICDADYEAKIAGLLERGYRRKVTADASAKERWRAAYAVLARGDHYLLVMIRRSINLRPWWAFWR